jgi:hypothetical protein
MADRASVSTPTTDRAEKFVIAAHHQPIAVVLDLDCWRPRPRRKTVVVSPLVVGARSKAAGMRKLYHVGNGDLKPGDSIAPGNWGKQSRQFGEGEGFRCYGNIKDAVIIGWEIALEAARQLTAPDAPSRLNCVFCTEDMESAKTFRDRFRPGESIFEVEVEDTVSTHAGNYDALTNAPRGPFVDTSVATAKSYWTDAPTGIREILVGGPAKVSIKIE